MPPPVTVIVFVDPVPLATIPDPTKFNVVAVVDNPEPSSCTVVPVDKAPLASYTTALDPGNVQNISLEPELQLTALLELELDIIVVRARVVPEEVKVPNPTSKSVPSVQQ